MVKMIKIKKDRIHHIIKEKLCGVGHRMPERLATYTGDPELLAKHETLILQENGNLYTDPTVNRQFLRYCPVLQRLYLLFPEVSPEFGIFLGGVHAEENHRVL